MCKRLNREQLRQYVDQINQEQGLNLSIDDFPQDKLCDHIAGRIETSNLPDFIGHNALDEIVVNLSNDLVYLKSTLDPNSKKFKMQESALRSLGADESKATIDLPEFQSIKKEATLQSSHTKANKTAKMMAGKVLSAYRSGKLKKDGTEMYLSYAHSLQNYINDNPDVEMLPQVQQALSLLSE